MRHCPGQRVRGPAPSRLGTASYGAAILLYVLVAAVAAFPRVLHGLGLGVRPLRVKAVLLSLLVCLGVNVAWLLLFEPPPRTTSARPADREERPGSQDHRV